MSFIGTLLARLFGESLIETMKATVLPRIVFFLGGTLLLGLVYLAGQSLGAEQARRECRAAAIEAELAAKKRDLAIAEQQALNGRQRSEELERQALRLEQKVSEYEAALAKRPAPGCIATDADIRRRLR